MTEQTLAHLRRSLEILEELLETERHLMKNVPDVGDTDLARLEAAIDEARGPHRQAGGPVGPFPAGCAWGWMSARRHGPPSTTRMRPAGGERSSRGPMC
jgi:Xaa-Pro aminopeptidase